MSKIIVRGLTEIIDPFYRYKMEPLNVVQQGRDIIVITNINEVCRDISSDQNDASNKTKMLIELIKKKFSIPIKCNKNFDRLELKGVTANDLQNTVFEFIEYFVLCPTCRNPETTLSKKSNEIYIKCRACSHYDKIKITNKLIAKIYDGYLKIF